MLLPAPIGCGPISEELANLLDITGAVSEVTTVPAGGEVRSSCKQQMGSELTTSVLVPPLVVPLPPPELVSVPVLELPLSESLSTKSRPSLSLSEPDPPQAVSIESNSIELTADFNCIVFTWFCD